MALEDNNEMQSILAFIKSRATLEHNSEIQTILDTNGFRTTLGHNSEIQKIFRALFLSLSCLVLPFRFLTTDRSCHSWVHLIHVQLYLAVAILYKYLF
jgi:hypothetical protein